MTSTALWRFLRIMGAMLMLFTIDLSSEVQAREEKNVRKRIRGISIARRSPLFSSMARRMHHLLVRGLEPRAHHQHNRTAPDLPMSHPVTFPITRITQRCHRVHICSSTLPRVACNCTCTHTFSTRPCSKSILSDQHAGGIVNRFCSFNSPLVPQSTNSQPNQMY